MQGKGRLDTEQTKYVFSYKSFFKKQHIFTLIVDIPLHGEESLVVDLDTKKISGSMVGHSKEYQTLKHFFHRFLPFFSYVKTLKEHRAQDCKTIKKNVFEEVFRCDFMEIKKNNRTIRITLINRGEQISRVTFSALNSFYRRAKLEDISSEKKWVLDLFPSECTMGVSL